MFWLKFLIVGSWKIWNNAFEKYSANDKASFLKSKLQDDYVL